MTRSVLLPLMALFACRATSDSFREAVAGVLDGAPAGLPPTFDPLLGSWVLSVTYAPGTDSARTWPGQWDFEKVLGGRAIQDVWRVDDRGAIGSSLKGYGTTIRVYDPELLAWRSTWIDVLQPTVTRFLGRAVNGEIELTPLDVDPGEQFRWVFYDLTDSTFRWRAESSPDSGRTWLIAQEIRARRRQTAE
jgi:hypothetical protein